MTHWQLILKIVRVLLQRDAFMLNLIKELQEANGVEASEEDAVRTELETLVSQLAEQTEEAAPTV